MSKQNDKELRDAASNAAKQTGYTNPDTNKMLEDIADRADQRLKDKDNA